MKIKKSQWLQLRRNSFCKIKTALVKYQRHKSHWQPEHPTQAQNPILYLKILFTPFAGDTADMFCCQSSPSKFRDNVGQSSKTSRVPFFFLSLFFIPCTARLSRTAAAGPWRPGWARWLGAAASQSQRLRPAWRVWCAWGRPGRW